MLRNRVERARQHRTGLCQGSRFPGDRSVGRADLRGHFRGSEVDTNALGTALTTGAWFDSGPCGTDLQGNPNVLAGDHGTSPPGQGGSAHSTLVEIERLSRVSPGNVLRNQGSIVSNWPTLCGHIESLEVIERHPIQPVAVCCIGATSVPANRIRSINPWSPKMAEPDMLASNLIGAIRANSRIAVIAGIIMLVCGVLAVAAPLAAGISITFLVGLLLIAGGVAQCVLAFQTGAFGRGLLIFLVGALTAVAGFFLISQPIEGLAAITFFLAAYFIVTGVFELVAAFQVKPAEGWGWLLFNGIVTLILGILIWRQFPLSGIWAVGVLFGIKLIMSGWWLIFVGRSVGSVAKDAAA